MLGSNAPEKNRQRTRTVENQKKYKWPLNIWHDSQIPFKLWVELFSPQNSYVGVLTSSTSECDLIWRQGLCRGIQVKMRSLGWTLLQHDRCRYRTRKFGHKHVQREDNVKRHRKKTAIYKSRREACNRSFPHSPQKEITLTTLWSWTSSFQNCETKMTFA